MKERSLFICFTSLIVIVVVTVVIIILRESIPVSQIVTTVTTTSTGMATVINLTKLTNESNKLSCTEQKEMPGRI